MCTRFRSVKDIEALIAKYGILFRINYPYNPNVAITDEVPIIVSTQEGNAIKLSRFGLIPSWAKDKGIGASLYNARSETIETKPAFRSAFKERRCIIPVEGFYEWTGPKGDKEPHYIYASDNGLLSLAGIWEHAKIDGEDINSFSIITTEPNSVTEPLHDRTPVILHDDNDWLKNGGKTQLKRPREGLLSHRSVNRAVNKTTVKDIESIEAIRGLI